MYRVRFLIEGIVQGVGFRPFVYKVANELGLSGFVYNTSNGVVVEVEGKSRDILKFEESLYDKAPPLAKIDRVSKEYIKPHKDKEFVILHSHTNTAIDGSIGADMSICQDCIEEMNNPNNRRFDYPFINCTNCGPRYTIIKSIPYDRQNTSMAKFNMCKECKKEYNNPIDRRYHAQPIACFECGPILKLYIKSQNGFNSMNLPQTDMIAECAKAIKEGKIVAIKGIGGFHLMCDATNTEAVANLRDKKHRPTKPLAVMVPDIEYLKKIAILNRSEYELITNPQRAIVLLHKRDNSTVASNVAPNIEYIGCMLPYAPIHYLLFNYLDIPIVATSANISGEPIITDGEYLRSNLGSVADMVLDNNRDIINACDDSVAMVVNNRVFWLRVARGVAPYYLPLKSTKYILGVGANQKSTISLSLGNKIAVSPHIGDLDTLLSLEYFKQTIETFKQIYEYDTDMIVCDKHPSYHSTIWAKKSGRNIIKLQHHYAHILAVMAEYNATDRHLAFAWDGTGYGDDGTIWGGEVMIADIKDYERILSFKPFRLLGGQKAIKEIDRVGISLLFDIYTLDEVLDMDISKRLGEFKVKTLYKMWQNGLNAPLTSSVGRLFDGVASIGGILSYSSYEGESGMMIEALSRDYIDKVEAYPYHIADNKIDISYALKDIAVHTNKSIAFAKFILMLRDIIVDTASNYQDMPIIVAGGVFQNRTLLELILKSPVADRLKLPTKIPLNDGSISIGQVWYGINNY